MRHATWIWIATAAVACAELKVPNIFSDGMVLQQQIGSPIWGWATPGAAITVRLGDLEQDAEADQSGYWMVALEGLQANAEGQDLLISGDGGSKTIKDVLVGEVWIASGQSNMRWKNNQSDGLEEVQKAHDPLLRVYNNTPNVAKENPQNDLGGQWQLTEPGKTETFTAVGYHFAKSLREHLNVPVGVVEVAWGGKPVEAFISIETLSTLPEAKPLLDHRAKLIAEFNPEQAKLQNEENQKKFQEQLAKWEESKEGEKPKAPQTIVHPGENSSLAVNIYNGMINPIAGYGARGAIWYQGESNANEGTASIYEKLQATLIQDWRLRWHEDLSFYFVQLANFREPTTEPGIDSHWVTVQDQQRRTLQTVSHTGMAIINDIGEADDIHPRNKKDVGERLARWALSHDYGVEDIVISGPLYSGSEVKDGKIIVSFDHAKGLASRDGGELKRFEIAGEDGAWKWASATIEGEKVILSSEEVPQPVKARYAWAQNPEGANLVNGEGLPTSVFTTED